MARIKLMEPKLSDAICAALADDAFRSALCEALGLSVGMGTERCHSNHFETALDGRETDVFLLARSKSGQRELLLAEVKILADFGHGQIDAYVARKLAALGEPASKRCCDHCQTAILAPKRYLDSHQSDVRRFDHSLSLERLLEIAEARSADRETSATIEHLISAARQALSDAKLGYVPLQHLGREDQFRYYREYCGEYAPHLSPHETKGTAQAFDIYHDSAVERWPIKHRLFRGDVMIELLGWGDLRGAVESALRPILTPEIEIVTPEFGRAGAARSIHLRWKRPLRPLSESRPFEDQRESLRGALDAVDAMWKWTDANRAILDMLSARRQETRLRKAAVV